MARNIHILDQALRELWAIPSPGPENLFSDPRFIALQSACETAFPEAGKGTALSIALWNAVRALGLPCNIGSARPELALTPEQAAHGLISALERTDIQRVYLCPLDYADSLPSMSFGPCTIHRFSPDELDDLFDNAALKRLFPGTILDTKRLSQFTWLVVRKTTPLDGEPGKRAVPFFYEDMRADSGRIEPHSNKLPALVERALFFILLAPWEDWSDMPEIDWRPFRIPWNYVSSDDIFESRVFPQSPDSLSWESKVATTVDGEQVEFEGPINLPLKDAAQSVTGMLTNDAWNKLQTALTSPLFETPVLHFLVRAFQATGIDEFLAFITVVEAALGLQSDYAKGASPKPYPDIGGTKRMAARVSALLGSKADGKIYSDLFNIRSAFLHGRQMNFISTADRVRARSLARRVANALIEIALRTSAPASREEFATYLLDVGVKMKV